MLLRKTTLAALFLLVAGLFLGPGPAAAQGRWMDLGSATTTTIALEGDPLSFASYPPHAFGGYEPSIYYVYAELLPRSCSTLPSTAICESGRFVAAFESHLEFESCPCSGALVKPVVLELHYDPARIAALDGREEDVRLTRYNIELEEWIALADSRTVPERDVVTGSHLGDARQLYALLLASPTSVSPSTWGRIKAQWSH